MPAKRDLKLDEYDIGKFAYRELYNFCLRYPDMKKKLADLRSPYSSPQITGMPRGSNSSDQTAANAERAATLSRDTELIEQTAIEAGGGFYQSLLENITNERKPYEQLFPPCGRRQFYEARRKFFFLLFQKKG